VSTFSDPDVRPGQLVIKTVHEGDRITLTVRGELDLMGTPVLERALAFAERLHPARLVLDLGGVEFIDSRGLCALLHANDRFGSAGCQVSLRQARSQARRLLKVSGLDAQFEFEADRPAGASL
jgi:anti-anti-sigma factor